MTSNENMKVAQCLFARWGKELLADSRIHGLLEALREKVEASGRVARELGLVAACKHCEEEEGGSCCGAGIEDHYTPHLLLINLLLGRTLPPTAASPTAAIFSVRTAVRSQLGTSCVSTTCAPTSSDHSPMRTSCASRPQPAKKWKPSFGCTKP